MLKCRHTAIVIVSEDKMYFCLDTNIMLPSIFHYDHLDVPTCKILISIPFYAFE